MNQLRFKKCLITLTAVLLLSQTAFSQTRKADIWDFGGVQTAGSIYSNNITRQTLDSLDVITAGKFTVTGEIPFGDLSLSVLTNDRMYYFNEDGSQGKNGAGNQGYAMFSFDDGYSANGIYYCNGTGGELRRFILIKNVKAGDRLTFYARTSNTADDTVNLIHLDAEGKNDGVQHEKAKINNVSTKYEYAAAADGTYKIYTDTAGAKPVYYRVMRSPAVEVSGRISAPAGIGSYALKFINQKTGAEIQAAVSGGSYKAPLTPGYSYTAAVTNVPGFGISAATKNIPVQDSAIASGKITAALEIVEQKVYKASGTISGFAPDYDVSKMSASFNPPAGTLFQSADLSIDASGRYTVILEPDVEYTLVLKGVNDYEPSSGGTIKQAADVTSNIAVALKPQYAVSGKFANLAQGAAVTKVSFTNMEDGYTYSGKTDGTSYTALLRNGSYTAAVEGTGYKTTGHVVVNGKTTVKDIRVFTEALTAQPLPLKQTLYVGYKDKKDSYATVRAALADAALMAPSSEQQRITIYIAPGVYREQLLVKASYVTLKNEFPGKEVKLTWYYGIGYKYYSIGKDGFYDENAAFDKFEKNAPARWGAAFYVHETASYFRAENITFESSFSKYITDEELDDGVVTDGTVTFERKLNSDVRSRKAIERSAAMTCYGDFAEFNTCRFIGSQDTLFTGNNVRGYYKDCFIEGNTDYIFGDGNIVFDRCELRWCGYSDDPSGGYLTAAKDTAPRGYLFRNCFISSNPAAKHAPAFFGRPWSAGAKVAFINTKIDRADSIDPAGWTSMSGNDPAKAVYREYNTTFAGRGLDVSKRTAGTVLASAAEYTPEAYFGDWKPAYYTAVPKSNPKFAAKPKMVLPAKVKAVSPGYTLSVSYKLDKKTAPYDTSLISWYRIDAKGAETLVKVSAGYADTSYTVAKNDIGCIIKAVVEPETVAYYKGKAAAVQLKTAVIKGDGTLPVKSTARAADKINVFLAGDSTVKDYSAQGMYNGGLTRSEGSWGEYLQEFLNKNTAAVQNFANGGRSSRSFINEGTLAKIASQIKAGDYLFIQFAHNDASNNSGHLEERFVPLGQPDAAGIYPVTAGKKVPSPAASVDKYGKDFYAHNSGGSYKWFLMQYIETARKAGATPVLVTPVARQYFDAQGNITPHHDSKDPQTKTQITSNNAYVEAVRQLAKEQKVLLIDGFEFTKALYEKAWKDAGKKTLPSQLMGDGDSTHNNKLGGFILAAQMAKEIKTLNIPLSSHIVRPSRVIGEDHTGQAVFVVKTSGELNAFTEDFSKRYTIESEYWSKYGQTLIDSLSK